MLGEERRSYPQHQVATLIGALRSRLDADAHQLSPRVPGAAKHWQCGMIRSDHLYLGKNTVRASEEGKLNSLYYTGLYPYFIRIKGSMVYAVFFYFLDISHVDPQDY